MTDCLTILPLASLRIYFHRPPSNAIQVGLSSHQILIPSEMSFPELSPKISPNSIVPSYSFVSYPGKLCDSTHTSYLTHFSDIQLLLWCFSLPPLPWTWFLSAYPPPPLLLINIPFNHAHCLCSLVLVWSRHIRWLDALPPLPYPILLRQFLRVTSQEITLVWRHNVATRDADQPSNVP